MAIIDHNQAPEVAWRPGYRKWDITTAAHGVDTSLSLHTGEPGTGAPLHTHAIDEIIVILSGELEVRINGETHRVSKDHTLAIPHDAIHGFTVVSDESAKLLVVFPNMDPYSVENTTYIEGGRPGL